MIRCSLEQNFWGLEYKKIIDTQRYIIHRYPSGKTNILVIVKIKIIETYLKFDHR